MTRSTLRRSAALLVCAAALGPSMTYLNGYSLTGKTWGTNRVPYYVNPKNVWVSDAAALGAVQTAASAWTLQSQANIELVYAGYTSGSAMELNYKNEVFFRHESGGGYTTWWSDGSGKLIDSDIVIYTANRPVFTGTSGCSGGVYIEDITTHEFGHVLGLNHSSDPTATMYPTMSSYCAVDWRYLAPDDIAGIEKLYPGSSGVLKPTAPSQLAVSPNSSDPTSSLLLSWTDNANNESGFRVERSTDGISFSLLTQIGADSTGYTASNLASATTHYFRVSAFNSAGSSSYSNIASGQTAASTTSSSAPWLSASGTKVKGVKRVNLSWAGFTNTSVDVYRNGAWVTTTPNDGSQTDSIGTKGGGSYSYRLCAPGTTVCSNTATVTY